MTKKGRTKKRVMIKYINRIAVVNFRPDVFPHKQLLNANSGTHIIDVYLN